MSEKLNIKGFGVNQIHSFIFQMEFNKIQKQFVKRLKKFHYIQIRRDMTHDSQQFVGSPKSLKSM